MEQMETEVRWPQDRACWVRVAACWARVQVW